jgi:hypothetical protein
MSLPARPGCASFSLPILRPHCKARTRESKRITDRLLRGGILLAIDGPLKRHASTADRRRGARNAARQFPGPVDLRITNRLLAFLEIDMGLEST